MSTSTETLPPGTSLWQATARVPDPCRERLAGSVQADVAIVGGGFTGLSAALHLAEAGMSVCLLESGRLGHGASGRNGGQVNPGVKLGEAALAARFGEEGRGLFRLGEQSVDFLADLIARKGLDCRFRRPGVIRLAHSPVAVAALDQAGADLAKRGVAVERLDADGVARRVGTTRYAAGLVDSRGGNLHPLDLARELARVAVAAGARIFVESRASHLAPEGSRWRVGTAEGSILADHVVVATNGYTDGLVPGLAASLLPVNSFQIATAPVEGDAIIPGGEAVYDSRRLILYFRRTPEGQVLLGGRASFSTSADDGRRASDYDVLVDVLHGLFPSLRGVPVVHRWTGLVCITPDFLPHYHEPAYGLHVALGFNGRGVALSNRTGAWLASRILDRPVDACIPTTGIGRIPLHPLRAPVLNAIMKWNHLMDKFGR